MTNEFGHKHDLKYLESLARELQSLIGPDTDMIVKSSLILDLISELRCDVVMNLKAYTVHHLTGRSGWEREDTSVIIASSKYEASTFVEGTVLNVSSGESLRKGECLSHSGWSLDGWANKKTPQVSEEWRQYLIRRNFDDGIED